MENTTQNTEGSESTHFLLTIIHGKEQGTYRVHYPRSAKTEVPLEDVHDILKQKSSAGNTVDISNIQFSSIPYDPTEPHYNGYELITFEKHTPQLPHLVLNQINEIAA